METQAQAGQQTETGFDFRAIELKWQKRWYDERVFEPAAEKDFEPDAAEDSRHKFFFTVPYPYVSGSLHVGHGRTYANGDVLARFRRMQGFNVLWPMAFHITGTPVLAVSAKIAAGDAETLALYNDYVRAYEKDEARVREIVASFKEPENVVKYFAVKLVEDFQKMGFSLDFSRRFTTGDAEYNKFIEWQFEKYREKNLLVQASHPVLFCLNCDNAVGEDDIKDGDTDPVELKRFVGIKSFFDDGEGDGGGFIISCTLRPETVFGVTNMFVNPAAVYVKARVVVSPEDKATREKAVEETWFVSKESIEKIKLQYYGVQVLKELKGEFFVGKTCVMQPTKKEIPILPGEFVNPANASGFVHSVPAHAPYDYVALEELRKTPRFLEVVEKIQPIALISLAGYGEFPAADIVKKMKVAGLKDAAKLEKATEELYREEYYRGKPIPKFFEAFTGETVSEVKEGVEAWLKREKTAVYFYETSRPAVCRCGGLVRVSVLKAQQWFLDFNASWRDDGVLRKWKDAARECLADMTVFPEVYRKQFEDVFDWLDKRPCARRRGLGTRLPFARDWIIESLSDSTIYMAFYTVIKKIREQKIRADQLTPAFFDFVFLGKGDAQTTAASTGASAAALSEIRREFLYWYPNDLRHTGVAHVANHLSFFIFAHAAIFAREHWPRGISLNEMVVSEGAKMSKSKGNVVMLNEVARDYGADLFRLYAVGAADFASTLDFRKHDIEVARRSLNKFFETALALIELSKASAPPTAVDSPLAKWAVSKFESCARDSTRALEEFRLRDYVQTAVYKQLNAFEKFLARATDAEKAFVARECATRWIQLLAPVAPHACEELWERAGCQGFASLSKWPQAREELISEEAEASQDFLESVAEDVRKIGSLLRGKRAARATIVVASEEKRRQARELVAQCGSAEELLKAPAGDSLKKFLDKRFYEFKEKPALLELKEFGVLNGAKTFLEKTLGLAVSVEREEESKSERAARAMPLKPAVVLE